MLRLQLALSPRLRAARLELPLFKGTSRLHRLHCASFSGKAKGGPQSQKLSRKERRLLERKQRNKERREQSRTNKSPKYPETNPTQPTIAVSKSAKILQRLRERVVLFFRPKVPGVNIRFGRDHAISLGYRLPLFLALCYVMTNDDIAPYAIQGSMGPSMLPTIQVFGDIWLVETWTLHRLLGWEPLVQVGDLVLWKDPDTNRVSCKRIIGAEGDTVQRFGQYSHLYQNREDFGVVSPKVATDQKLDTDVPWDLEKTSMDPSRTLEVPEGHLWLEGDCPLLSLDSRHYGPIPVSWLSGRLVLRLWPMQREDEDGEPIPCRISRDRPKPFPSIDWYLGKSSNLHRIPRNQ